MCSKVAKGIPELKLRNASPLTCLPNLWRKLARRCSVSKIRTIYLFKFGKYTKLITGAREIPYSGSRQVYVYAGKW